MGAGMLAGAFGGGGGYDFGDANDATGGTLSSTYRSSSSAGVSPWLIGGLVLAALAALLIIKKVA